MPLFFSSRRQWMASVLPAPLLGYSRAAGLPVFGLQLYTLRAVLPKAPEATLEQVAKMGYREVEALRDSLGRVAPIARKLGLAIPACHMEAAVVTGRWRNASPVSMEQTAEEIRAAGADYAVLPWIDFEDRGGEDVFRALAEKMNRAAEICRKAGLQFVYHHHAFEFAPVAGSRTGMDIFLAECDRNLVQYEVDIFWLKIAGQDPAAFLARMKGRVPLLHVKDVAAGAPVQFTEKLAPATFKEVGQGTLPIPAILRAAREAGVKHYIVEQDQCPGDPLDSVRISAEYLKQVTL